MRVSVRILLLAVAVVVVACGILLVVAKDKTCPPWSIWTDGCLNQWQTLWAGILSLIAAFVGAFAILWQTRVQIQTTIESEVRAEERTREKLRAAYRDSITELLEDVRIHLERLEAVDPGLADIELQMFKESTLDSILRPGVDRSSRKAADLVPTRQERMTLRGFVPAEMFMWITDVQRHLEGCSRLLTAIREKKATARPPDVGAWVEVLKARLSRAVEELDYLKRALDGEKVSPPS